MSIDGLKGRPELNGRSGVAGRFDAAKGRYEVAVEGEAKAVLLKPANLREVFELSSSTFALTLAITVTVAVTVNRNRNRKVTATL